MTTSAILKACDWIACLAQFKPGSSEYLFHLLSLISNDEAHLLQFVQPKFLHLLVFVVNLCVEMLLLS